MRSNSSLVWVPLMRSMVQDICNKNYVKFCDSMDNVITMRQDVKDLSVSMGITLLVLEECLGFPRGNLVCRFEVGFRAIPD